MRLLPHGLQLHLALNGDMPYFSRAFQAHDELLAWAEEERVLNHYLRKQEALSRRTQPGRKWAYTRTRP